MSSEETPVEAFILSRVPPTKPSSTSDTPPALMSGARTPSNIPPGGKGRFRHSFGAEIPTFVPTDPHVPFTVPDCPDGLPYWPCGRTVTREQLTTRRAELTTKIKDIEATMTISKTSNAPISAKERKDWDRWNTWVSCLAHCNRALGDLDGYERALFELLANRRFVTTRSSELRQLMRIYEMKGETAKAAYFRQQASMAEPYARNALWEVPKMYGEYEAGLIQAAKEGNVEQVKRFSNFLERKVDAMDVGSGWEVDQEDRREKLERLLRCVKERHQL